MHPSCKAEKELKKELSKIIKKYGPKIHDKMEVLIITEDWKKKKIEKEEDKPRLSDFAIFPPEFNRR